MNINTFLTDFAKIAGGYKPLAEKVNEADFIARLVICYKDSDKAKNEQGYNSISDYVNKINAIEFTNKRKENKYFYLLHKSDFENESDFVAVKNALQQQNDNKIITINANNIALPKIQAILKLQLDLKISVTDFSKNK